MAGLAVGLSLLQPLIQVLFEKAINAASDELNLVKDFKEQLHRLTGTLSAIQALLEDAEAKQFEDISIRTWLSNLKDVAYDMDDLLDQYASETRRGSNRRIKFLRSWPTSYKFAHRIKKIQDRFSRMARERDELGLQILGGAVSQIHSTYRPQTSSLVDGSKVFGREEETQAIVNKLLCVDKANVRVSVIPIVGMGGLGKTTLAQRVYNDDRVKEHFQLRMWICVSDNFDELKLTKETLNCAEHDSSSLRAGYTTVVSHSHVLTNMNLVQVDLREKLKGKRFLLVLDDVWNDDPRRWDCYRTALSAGDDGSAIIVTTQNLNVGRVMGGFRAYHLKQLSDEDCWTLFRDYAFVGGDSSAHPNLEKIGMEIVKKLKGLPLAVKAIGGLLYSKTDEQVWREILRSEIWESPLGKNNILPALRLSYKHLDSNLKQCFAFCSVYHKDFVFQKDKLVRIWIALGFIQAQGKKRLEDVGNSFFDELVSRSFFQPYKGNYMMHDAIHDLAQSLTVEECRKLGDDTLVRGMPERIRHASLSSNNSKTDSFHEFYKFNKLRTLMLLRGYKSKISQIPTDLFLRLKWLRVLDLHRRGINELPNSLGNLRQLRYLSVAGTEIERLPSSISKLHNLQTLDLTNCNLLTEIPKGITRLSNLRHLETTSSLISEIAGIGSLTSLQELAEFLVRRTKGYTIAELEYMSQLQGKLYIRNLENVGDSKEASKAQLNAKEFLQMLLLEWDYGDIVPSEEEHWNEEILDALRPHYELKELKINGYAGFQFPNWFGDPSFCYLESIYLSNCVRCRVLPALGQLPLLKYLEIGEFQTLSRIGTELYGSGNIKGFPKLVELTIQDIRRLECWVLNDDDDLFPSLRELEIIDCPKLSKLPNLPPTISRLRVAETGLDTLPEMQTARTAALLTVEVHDCPYIESLQEGLFDQQLQLVNLEQLRITDCEELVSLHDDGFRSLASLKSLHIRNCPKLAGWNDGRRLLPDSLEDLQILSCDELIDGFLAEAKHLPSLQHLTMAMFPRLYHFPDDELPASLKVLGISECENLQNLPGRLYEISSLTTLILNECTSVRYLPYLPRKLEELRISRCPLLNERCQADDGEDWHKLAYVRRVQIDGVIVSSGFSQANSFASTSLSSSSIFHGIASGR